MQATLRLASLISQTVDGGQIKQVLMCRESYGGEFKARQCESNNFNINNVEALGYAGSRPGFLTDANSKSKTTMILVKVKVFAVCDVHHHVLKLHVIMRVFYKFSYETNHTGGRQAGRMAAGQSEWMKFCLGRLLGGQGGSGCMTRILWVPHSQISHPGSYTTGFHSLPHPQTQKTSRTD